MIISTTEVQNNFGKYLKLVEKEDIIITRNGKKVARLVNYKENDDYIIREDSTAYSYDGMEVSYEEFLKIAETSEKRYEYIDGKMFFLASPSIQHQKVAGEIYTNLSLWFRGRECIPIFAPLDVTLLRGEDNINVVQPDILVICDQENIDDESGKYTGVPTLVIEVLSESTRNNDFIKKLDLYRASGVEEYWIVNPFKEQIILYFFENNEIAEMETYKGDDEARSVVFPGLKIKLREVFSG